MSASTLLENRFTYATASSRRCVSAAWISAAPFGVVAAGNASVGSRVMEGRQAGGREKAVDLRAVGLVGARNVELADGLGDEPRAQDVGDVIRRDRQLRGKRGRRRPAADAVRCRRPAVAGLVHEVRRERPALRRVRVKLGADQREDERHDRAVQVGLRDRSRLTEQERRPRACALPAGGRHRGKRVPRVLERRDVPARVALVDQAEELAQRRSAVELRRPAATLLQRKRRREHDQRVDVDTLVAGVAEHLAHLPGDEPQEVVEQARSRAAGDREADEDVTPAGRGLAQISGEVAAGVGELLDRLAERLHDDLELLAADRLVQRRPSYGWILTRAVLQRRHLRLVVHRWQPRLDDREGGCAKAVGDVRVVVLMRREV